MKRIAQFAVNRPASMIVLVALIVIMGIMNLTQLPIDLMPEMELPVAAVITSYPGAGPEEVEDAVSKKIESALGTVSNINTISSTSSANSSIVVIQFDYGTNMDEAMANIRDKVSIAESMLGDDVEKPMVVKMDLNMMPVIQITMNGDSLSLADLQRIAEDEIEPRLSRIAEVASVTITGGREKEIRVAVDPVKADNYGISLGQITNFLRSENYNMSSGSITYGSRDYFVRSMQEFEHIEDIENVAITTTTGNTVYLKDIANITEGYKDMQQITRTNGKYAVGIHCQKETDANTVAACSAVKEELSQLEKELGQDLEFNIVMDQSDYINDAMQSTTRSMAEGAILAVLIILLFLRNIRSTLIVGTAIPLSIVATFIVLYYNGSTLNMITLGGLALGIGRIVDDSIVVFENIYRHRSLGLSPKDAAVTGTAEVGGAVLAGTLTLMAVFVPIGMADGISGILFRPLALTIVVAIACSLLVSLTIVPFMSSRMLTDQAMEKKNIGKGKTNRFVDGMGTWLDNLGEKYKRILQWALGHRKVVVFSVIGLMIASLMTIPLVGAEFIPASDSGEINITLEADKGTKIEDMNILLEDVEEKIHQNPLVDVIFTSIGSTGQMGMSTAVNEATLYVKIVPKGERQKDVQEVADEFRQTLAAIPGIKTSITIGDQMSAGSSGGAVSVKVRGDDLDTLKSISADIADLMKTVPGTREVDSSLADGDPEVQVKINRKRAASYGLTPIQISSEIKNAMNGAVASTYRVDGDETDIRVLNQGYDAQDYNDLTGLRISTPMGTSVDLAQLATFELSRGPVQINREDQVRQATISCDLLNRDLKSVMQDIQTGISEMQIPPGYQIEYGGDNEQMMDSFASLLLALILAIMLVYVVLVVQYESFTNPFIIMFSIPTGIIGVILALLITGRSFSVTAFIGIIMLVGIVLSNAIVFIEYLTQLRDAGMERNPAIVEAGRVRLRPILMTSLSTILAMVPMATGIGEGAETNAPLATAVIGGLIASTFITLVLIPVIYSLFDDWGQKHRNKKASRKQQAAVNID